MSSFLKKIFGGKREDAPAAPGAVHESESYKDCTVTPTPLREGSQWRVAGRITKAIGGETFERTFVRADLLGSEDECAAFSVRKAQQIIDQNPMLFSGEKTGTA